METNTAVLTRRLDELEESLPRVPAAALEFTRAGVRRVNHTVATVGEHLGDRFGTASGSIVRATKTVSGQTTSAGRRLIDFAEDRVAEVRGQAAAQARRATDSVAEQVDGALTDGTEALDPQRPLSKLTKAELYDLAQERDIDGRSSMTKSELVAALQR